MFHEVGLHQCNRCAQPLNFGSDGINNTIDPRELARPIVPRSTRRKVDLRQFRFFLCCGTFLSLIPSLAGIKKCHHMTQGNTKRGPFGIASLFSLRYRKSRAQKAKPTSDSPTINKVLEKDLFLERNEKKKARHGTRGTKAGFWRRIADMQYKGKHTSRTN